MSKFWGLLDLSQFLAKRRQTTDRRSYERFEIPDSLNAGVHLEGHKEPFKILDLSYDGFRLNKSNSYAAAAANATIMGTISILGHKITLKSKIVSISDNWIGFRFIHDTPDALLEIRNILEPMRKGLSLASINNQSEIWHQNRALFRGDGPTEVSIIRTNTKELLFASVLINESDFVTEVTVKNGVTKVSKGAIKLGRISSQTLEEKFDSRELIRGAIFILSQMNLGPENAVKNSFVETLENHLREKHTKETDTQAA